MDVLGGSFWDAYGDGGESISEVLMRPGTTLEEILGMDIFLQSFREENEHDLQNYMVSPGIVSQLIEYLTVEPAADATWDRAHKFPFVSRMRTGIETRNF